MKTSRKIFVISSSRERVTRATAGVSTRTTEGEAPKPDGCCRLGGECCVALWFEPELASIMALSLSSSSSKIITGAAPCDLEPDGRFAGPWELRGRMGSFTSVFGKVAAGMCGSPEDNDFCVLPNRLSSVSWILCRRREQMSLEKFREGYKGGRGIIRT